MSTVEEMKKIEKRLRNILENIYDSSSLITFFELAESFANVLPSDFEILFYIRSKARFSDLGVNDEFLKFSYMSFHYSNNKWKKLDFRDVDGERQSSFNKTTTIERHLIERGFKRQDTNNISIVYPVFEDLDMLPIVNLTKRIFIAFYKNCGGYDHYKESTLSRYLKEYYKKYNFKKVENLILYCKSEFGLDVVIANHNEKLFSAWDAGEYQMLIDTLKGEKIIIECLMDEKEFKNDLRTSIYKKNQTFGKAKDGTYYVVRTFSNNYLEKNTDEKNNHNNEKNLKKIYKSQQKNLVVYTSINKICLENVFYANNIIRNVLTTLEEYERGNLIHKLNDNCLNIEERTSEHPVEKYPELIRIFSDMFQNVIERSSDFTVANNICIYYHNPVDEGLIPFVYTANVNKETPKVVSCGDLQNISAQVHVVRATIIYPNKSRMKKSFDKYKKEGDEKKIKCIESDLKDRSRFVDSYGSNESSVYAAPIMVGNILWGVCEFSSETASELSSDVAFFNHLCSAFGDCVRRVSLANDRGWLTKMSFVHAARHRIEAIVRDLQVKDIELATELQGVFDQHAVLSDHSDLNKKNDTYQRTVRRVKEMAVSKWSENVIEQLEVKIFNRSEISIDILVAIREIFETLISNEQHSPIDPDGLKVKRSPEGEFESIHIQYLQKGSSIPISKTKQMCLSPIKDSTTRTYHYGLFLLAAQIRMIGGLVSVKSEDTGLGGSLFGISFLLPIKK